MINNRYEWLWCYVCWHKWTNLRRKFTESRSEAMSFSGASEKAAMKFNYGFTTIERHCQLCGELDFRTESGDQT
jgi:hypothetical protein